MGTGIDDTIKVFNSVPKCTVCNGKKIIHTDTAVPPSFGTEHSDWMELYLKYGDESGERLKFGPQVTDQNQCEHEYVPVLTEEPGKMLCLKCGHTTS